MPAVPPDLKGKVESEIGYTQQTALKGGRFESIEEQNVHLDHWDERWAMTRIHGTTKRQVRAMFEEEKPALQPFPPIRFEYYRVCDAPSTSMGTSKSRARTTLLRRAMPPQNSGSCRPIVAADS